MECAWVAGNGGADVVRGIAASQVDGLLAQQRQDLVGCISIMVAQGFVISSRFTSKVLATFLVRPVAHSKLVPSARRARARANNTTGMQAIMFSINRARITSLKGIVQSFVTNRAGNSRATGSQVRTIKGAVITGPRSDDERSKAGNMLGRSSLMQGASRLFAAAAVACMCRARSRTSASKDENAGWGDARSGEHLTRGSTR